MKKYILFIAFIAFYFNNISIVKSQCTPDPLCIDTGATGEICPAVMPTGTVGVAYNQTATIIPPASGTVGTTTINLCAVKVVSIGNLPPGLTYATNPSTGYFPVTSPSTSYCALISGTPTTAGVYNLKITVTPYTTIVNCTALPTNVTDSTSVSITINNATGINNFSVNKDNVLNCSQNPFISSTQIFYHSNLKEEIELKVFDMLGNIVYKEKLNAVIGENIFKFNGSNLHKGIYIYTVNNKKDVYTKKLIKSN